jgi:hypothetical protein
MGFSQSVISRISAILIARSSGPVDADRQGAHARHPLGDFHAQQHATTAWLGTLAQHNLDGVGLAQVIRVHPVARGQVLVDQVL